MELIRIDSRTSIGVLKTIGNLMYVANREFYDLFELSPNVLQSMLLEMLDDDRGEFAEIGYCDHDVKGAFAAYPAKDIGIRQMFSAAIISKYAKDARSVLAEFAKGLPCIERPNALYLSRIASRPEHLRSGVGSYLLSQYERFVESGGYSEAVMHVHSKNTTAILFYLKRGYSLINRNKNYHIMYKTLKGDSCGK